MEMCRGFQFRLSWFKHFSLIGCLGFLPVLPMLFDSYVGLCGVCYSIVEHMIAHMNYDLTFCLFYIHIYNAR